MKFILIVEKNEVQYKRYGVGVNTVSQNETIEFLIWNP